MFRGKESSNRIELSRLVQDLLNFGVLGSLWLCGGGRWVGGCLGAFGVMGNVPTCTHMHAHACMHMYRNCKWLPTWRHPCLACLSCLTCMCVCTCVHMHVHACMHGISPHTPIPTSTLSTHLPPPRGSLESVNI